MRNKLKIKKGDKVIVLAGKDKGKSGVVLKSFPKTMRMIVQGINIVKRHVKPNQAFPEGGIIPIEASIHYSNLALLDPKVEKATKIGYKILEDGRKVRFARKTGEVIDN